MWPINKCVTKRGFHVHYRPLQSPRPSRPARRRPADIGKRCIGARLAISCGRSSSAVPRCAVPYRQPPPSLPAAGLCPRCPDASMRAEELGESQVARCARCHGLWISSAEFNLLVADLDRREAVRVREPLHLAHEDQVRYLNCPKCGECMSRQIFGRTSGIVVDICRRHGIWLDRGEIRRVLEYLATRSSLAKPPAPAQPPQRRPRARASLATQEVPSPDPVAWAPMPTWLEELLESVLSLLLRRS
ncbi:hypothetical protein Hoch_5184 [Haliangium ochraceum DSM 14365]|uniref:Transcription factor zinc-finger domain-containing protein n=1 Tax=Haliangium ochraceum (strain DSM 14365 / JCM 11303 / SMP-2) TaxID=502025 RepID=D0LWM2_HALO1|nr:hypothetical protein Hoch_5184 [Haliangium ochraceum DSM 14365]